MEENIDQLCKIAGEFGMRGVAARGARAAGKQDTSDRHVVTRPL